ncbi:MAG: MDR family MFS transporter [Ardenticatenaceae bacterium]
MANSVRAGVRARLRGGEPVVQTTNQITGRRRWWALGAVMLSMFFSALNQTTVSTALPVVIGELQGFTLYAWVFTAYMLASAITVPIYGKLSDVYGRKPFYVLGLGLFIVGSAACGLVQNMPQLIVARAFQGLGAGGMLSMPQATIGDIFNPRQRGRWLGLIASAFGIASVIGPTFGGWITDHWGWRWVFYVNLPVAAVALVAMLYALPTVRVERHVRVDWLGILFLVAGLVPLLLAFTWVGNEYSWLSAPILLLFGASVLFLSLFALVERRAPSPIIAPELFKNRLFLSTTTLAFLVSMAMFGGIIFLPLFVQGVMGLSAQASGQIMTPMMLSLLVGSALGGQMLTRTGRYRLQAFGGTILMALGMFLLSRMGPQTTPLTVVRNVILVGFGIGSILPLLNVAVQNAFPYGMMGMVSATQQFVRSLGGVIAAPILGAVLVQTFAADFTARLPSSVAAALRRLPAEQQAQLVDPQGLINAQTQAAIQSSFTSFGEQGAQLYEQFLQAVRLSLAAGTTQLFLLGLGVTLLALGLVFFMPEIPLQQDEFFEE